MWELRVRRKMMMKGGMMRAWAREFLVWIGRMGVRRG
jgi:hypothetical protein